MTSATTTPIEARLPGLEVPEVSATPTPGHYIERGPQKRLMVFSGSSNPELAGKIVEKLGIELGAVRLETFANGENYCRYEESIRGADAFIVQSGQRPVNDHLWELLEMVQAARLASAKRVTAVIPWFPYSRQDKKSAPREPITAKLVADCLGVAGADRVLTMDLHAGQIQGFFGIPVDHMTALPLFAQYYRDKGLQGETVVVVAPDPGRSKMAAKFGQMLDADWAVLNKERPAHDEAFVSDVIGRVRGKVAIMSDDIYSTGSTLLAGAAALKEAGATEVYACATHGLFAGEAFGNLDKCDLVEVAVTDTVPIDPLKKPGNVQVLSVSGLLAETILNVFGDDSVSAIFAGENQLF
jgi:ribose-phosphate pyrophosphokinase